MKTTNKLSLEFLSSSDPDVTARTLGISLTDYRKREDDVIAAMKAVPLSKIPVGKLAESEQTGLVEFTVLLSVDV